jgi:hypothetical protein
VQSGVARAFIAPLQFAPSDISGITIGAGTGQTDRYTLLSILGRPNLHCGPQVSGGKPFQKLHL